ncbi:phosphatase PAP2 family protein [candidate division KSB1 bacterium]|nr:phosphatase PAP2 family protein [candidate division KSB1 bacterium]
MTLKYAIRFFLIIGAVFASIAQAQQPYELNQTLDASLTCAGGILTLVGSYVSSRINPLNEDAVNRLSKESINPFDRRATEYWSPAADEASDVLEITYIVLPLSLLLSNKIRDDYQTYGAMYLQTALFTAGMVQLTKGLTQRARPYAYNPELAMQRKMTRDARRSFYSGHTAAAFSSAAFITKVYYDTYPDSKWKPVVAGTSFLGASIVGLLRVKAGKHFPTDVLVGAMMGTLTGYLIPELHKKDAADIIQTRAQPDGIQFSVRFSLN